MENDIVSRVRIRIPDKSVSDGILNEYVQTANDRICLRLGVDEVPKLFKSIVVDVVVKMHRRTFYEGISSESADTLTTSFVDDLLNEYSGEFQTYKDRMKDKDSLMEVSFI